MACGSVGVIGHIELDHEISQKLHEDLRDAVSGNTSNLERKSSALQLRDNGRRRLCARECDVIEAQFTSVVRQRCIVDRVHDCLLVFVELAPRERKRGAKTGLEAHHILEQRA
ncbi:hypothetical protein D3C78_129600 [compost metagenome]